MVRQLDLPFSNNISYSVCIYKYIISMCFKFEEGPFIVVIIILYHYQRNLCSVYTQVLQLLIILKLFPVKR